MLVIGIDPGTATTGYGLVQELDDGSLSCVAYGAILTQAKFQPHERLLILFERLNELLLLHKPTTGAVEQLFFQRNVRTAISVGQGRGVALLALAQAKLSVAEYTPLEIKQAVVGYGGAEKHQVQEMVRAILCLEDLPQPDDAADALAVAICHLHSHHMRSLYEEV
jgi:crossover junction endodeoxyribonuclease RuvC